MVGVVQLTSPPATRAPPPPRPARPPRPPLSRRPAPPQPRRARRRHRARSRIRPTSSAAVRSPVGELRSNVDPRLRAVILSAHSPIVRSTRACSSCVSALRAETGGMCWAPSSANGHPEASHDGPEATRHPELTSDRNPHVADRRSWRPGPTPRPELRWRQACRTVPIGTSCRNAVRAGWRPSRSSPRMRILWQRAAHHCGRSGNAVYSTHVASPQGHRRNRRHRNGIAARRRVCLEHRTPMDADRVGNRSRPGRFVDPHHHGGRA